MKNPRGDGKYSQFGLEVINESEGRGIAVAVNGAISQAEMAVALREKGVFSFRKVICLAEDSYLRGNGAQEALQRAGQRPLTNLILILPIEKIFQNTGTRLSNFQEKYVIDLQNFGWNVETINGDDIHAIGHALLRARINETQQPQVIIANIDTFRRGKNLAAIRSDDGAFCRLKMNFGLPDEEFFVPNEVRNYFTLLTMRRHSDYENWQYRFECAVDRYPEILQVIAAKGDIHAH
jgi:transketolase